MIAFAVITLPGSQDQVPELVLMAVPRALTKSVWLISYPYWQQYKMKYQSPIDRDKRYGFSLDFHLLVFCHILIDLLFFLKLLLLMIMNIYSIHYTLISFACSETKMAVICIHKTLSAK